jgi:hypothetical protein
MNIELQGVQCFYRALNYVLLDENRMSLQLELSSPSYTDSLFFERVTADGQLLQTWGRVNATANQFTYTQLASDLPAGTIYIRARIKLKSGAIVYTDIIPVISSGSQSIVFYPNPVSRYEPLKYILKQGVAPDSRLMIYDIWGRLIRDYVSLPGSVDLSGLMAGVYLFKLVGRGGVEVGVERVVVR